MGCEKLSAEKVAELVVPNEKYCCEVGQIYERWSKTDFLKGIEDKLVRSGVAVLLENQKLMNECSVDAEGDQFKEAKSKLIRLAAAVYPNLLAWKLISIQPMLGPAGLIYHLCRRKSTANGEKMTVIESEDITARTRKYKRRVCSDFGPNDVSHDIIRELDTEFLTDLWSNCATVSAVNLKAYLSDKAVRLEEAIISGLKSASERLGHCDGELKPNWMVVNSGLYRRLKKAFENIQLSENLSIYPHSGVEGILIGYKGETYMDTGYVFSPYVPFTLTPSLVDVSGTYGLLVRYGKKLLREGSRYYSRITVFDDVPDEE